MSETPNADRIITEKLKDVSLPKNFKTEPRNVVLVTVEDVIEIFHELQPYTMQKLDSHVPTDDGQSCSCGYFVKTNGGTK